MSTISTPSYLTKAAAHGYESPKLQANKIAPGTAQHNTSYDEIDIH